MSLRRLRRSALIWRHLEDDAGEPASTSVFSVWMALRCNSPISEQARALGIEAERLERVLEGEGSLTESEQIRADGWLGVAWLRHARRCGEQVTDEDEARAIAEARMLGCEVGDGC